MPPFYRTLSEAWWKKNGDYSRETCWYCRKNTACVALGHKLTRSSKIIAMQGTQFNGITEVDIPILRCDQCAAWHLRKQLLFLGRIGLTVTSGLPLVAFLVFIPHPGFSRIGIEIKMLLVAPATLISLTSLIFLVRATRRYWTMLNESILERRDIARHPIVALYRADGWWLAEAGTKEEMEAFQRHSPYPIEDRIHDEGVEVPAKNQDQTGSETLVAAAESVPAEARKYMIESFARKAIETPVWLSTEIAEISTLVDQVVPELIRARPGLESTTAVRQTLDCLSIYCVGCRGLFTPEVVRYAAVVGDLKAGILIAGGPNVAAIMQGKCPICGGRGVLALFNPGSMAKD